MLIKHNINIFGQNFNNSENKFYLYMNNKELIVSLIKDNLINTRLVHGLDLLGLDSGNYHIHLSQTIFNLIGIEDNRMSCLKNTLKCVSR